MNNNNLYDSQLIQLPTGTMRQESNERTSFVHRRIGMYDVIKVLVPFGFKSFGTQHDHIQSFRQQFVKETKWLSESQYREIVNMCGSLPGSTAVQIFILISTLLTKSPFISYIAFFAFCLMSSLVLLFLGTLVRDYVQDENTLPVQLRLVFLGFKAAGAGIIFSRLIHNVSLKKQDQNLFKISIMLGTTILYFYFRSTACIEACLFFGGVLSLYVETDVKKKMNEQTRQVMKSMSKYSILFGSFSTYLLLGIYLILWLVFKFHPQSPYVYCGIFYFVACFIFGPASTIFAFLFAYFSESQLMTPEQFWLGVPLAYLLPGTSINIAVYYGTLIDGARGALLAWVCIYLPAFLSVYGILPDWYLYRDRPGIQRLLIGVSCVSSGLALASIAMLLQHCMDRDVGVTVGVFIITVFFRIVVDIWAPLLILVGGFLANTRRWGLLYYRFKQAPDYLPAALIASD